MAYVSVPKDLAEVKTRLIFNLTKRQVICFGAAAVIGVPLFLSFRGVLGNTGAMTLMIAAVIPAFFFAIYSKDGVIPAEKFILLVLRKMFLYPKIRVYRTANMYVAIENMAQNEQEGYFEKTAKPAGAGQKRAANKTAKRKASPESKPVGKTRRT
jgi:ABC-type uncharacterized transport system permease subunit